jgi:hypothetical protein
MPCAKPAKEIANMFTWYWLLSLFKSALRASCLPITSSLCQCKSFSTRKLSVTFERYLLSTHESMLLCCYSDTDTDWNDVHVCNTIDFGFCVHVQM